VATGAVGTRTGQHQGGAETGPGQGVGTGVGQCRHRCGGCRVRHDRDRGGDGAGKSTQVALLRDAFEAAGRTVTVTRQPGGTTLGREIRDLVLHGDHVAPRAEALLFAADKAHHVDQLIRPALERGEVVLTDRYTDSSVAYQGAGRDLGAQEIHDLNMWAVDDLVPDLTVVVDISAAEGRRRRGDVHDRLEAEEDAFHDAIRAHYLAMAQGNPQRYVVVDGTLSPDEIHALVLERLRDMGALP
jgi:dTMP kinase